MTLNQRSQSLKGHDFHLHKMLGTASSGGAKKQLLSSCSLKSQESHPISKCEEVEEVCLYTR